MDPADLEQGNLESPKGEGSHRVQNSERPAGGTFTPADSIAAIKEHVRDRIVILGRRRSGKTIYLARLYDELWKSRGDLHMRAISGETHKACMQVVEELRSGQWPASTLGAQYSDIEITFRGRKHLLVALDYPGEVFRKAFVDDADTEDAKELLEHVDKAAAVMLLLDPSVVESGNTIDAIDDDFGMVQAVHRIREWPGGSDVPIVVVFTKCDVHKRLLRKNGGLKNYLVTRYGSLIRAMNRFKVFAAAAVHTRPGKNGEFRPTLEKRPVGVIEPLEYCLDTIVQRGQEKLEAEQLEKYQIAEREQRHQEYLAQRRSVLFWSIFWSVALVVLGAIGIFTWVMVHGGSL